MAISSVFVMCPFVKGVLQADQLPRGKVQHAMYAIGDAAHGIAHKIGDNVHLRADPKASGSVAMEPLQMFPGDFIPFNPFEDGEAMREAKNPRCQHPKKQFRLITAMYCYWVEHATHHCALLGPNALVDPIDGQWWNIGE